MHRSTRHQVFNFTLWCDCVYEQRVAPEPLTFKAECTYFETQASPLVRCRPLVERLSHSAVLASCVHYDGEDLLSSFFVARSIRTSFQDVVIMVLIHALSLFVRFGCRLPRGSDRFATAQQESSQDAGCMGRGSLATNTYHKPIEQQVDAAGRASGTLGNLLKAFPFFTWSQHSQVRNASPFVDRMLRLGEQHEPYISPRCEVRRRVNAPS